MTGRGVICFITNYSWLDGLSHPGMRERFLDVFDGIWIDSLNGDKYRTGKQTPLGEPDPSIFSTDLNKEGIQVGTAITTLVRNQPHLPAKAVKFREFWGKNKREALLRNSGEYVEFEPVVELGLSFNPGSFGTRYLEWPLLSSVLRQFFSGVQTKRDEVVVDFAKDALIQRMERYFDRTLSDSEIRQFVPRSMEASNRFDPKKTRRYLLQRGFLADHVVQYYYRPFDLRWIYWEPETRLLGEKSPEYYPNVVPENVFLVTTGRTRKFDPQPPIPTSIMVDLNAMDSGARAFPLYLVPRGELCLDERTSLPRPNLSETASEYLRGLGADERELFYHIVAILHAPAYRSENAGALRQDWPRIPFPADAASSGGRWRQTSCWCCCTD